MNDLAYQWFWEMHDALEEVGVELTEGVLDYVKATSGQAAAMMEAIDHWVEGDDT